MAVRISGMVSGLDTDSIVQELVSAYSTKKENIVKSQTKLSWKQDAWKSLNSEVYSLYNKIGNYRYDSAYNLKTSSVSDSSKATVTASSSAVNGTQSLKIKSLATSGYMTGGKLAASDGSSVTTSTTLSQLGFSGSNTSFKVKDADGNETSIDVSSSSTIKDVISGLKSAGVNASFDSSNGRIFVNSSSSGAASDFSITTGGNDFDESTGALSDSFKALASLGLVSKTDIEDLQAKYAADEGDDETTAAAKAANLSALNAALKSAGLADDDGNATDKAGTMIHGTDAEIELNGATFTSSTNSFTINGLTINATETTGDNAVTITTGTDTQGIYDKVKDFFSSYNDLINKMTSLYNAESAKGYEPLTDDEKDAMSETEIEKWEDKIKSALLRRDSTLGNLLNAMTTSMSGMTYIDENGTAITYNVAKGKYYYGDEEVGTSMSDVKSFAGSKGGFTSYALSSFGIATLGFLNAAENEQNAFHIDGDEDDEKTSGKTDKLMAMIQSDPDTVTAFMKNLSATLYGKIDNMMKSTTMSSAYTVYNDKQMNQEYSDYSTSISDWEDKLEDLEDYYYDKFSAMETALQKLQDQTSSLTSLLGG